MAELNIMRRSLANDAGALDALPPLLQRIYRARQIVEPGMLNRELTDLLPYHELLHSELAASTLADAIAEQLSIVIVGDFDADGATSTSVAVSALRLFGAKHVNYVVPNRFTYGYGLTPEIVDVVHAMGADIIITVDNGIANHAGVTRANSLGIRVIITDHHLAAETLPDAEVIVNPNQPDDNFPSKNLAGVGVIFYVMLALRAELVKREWFTEHNISVPNMAQFLDLVALGTVADVVPLDKNNRILVHQGLRRIQAGHIRPGILALLRVAKREPARLQASDLGFAIGPRLNAAGRLDDMSQGINCLLAEDMAEAMKLAEQLDQLNVERRQIEAVMQREAFDITEHLQWKGGLPTGLVLYDETWHQGVVGLLASRVKDKWHRPVVAFARAEDGSLKGSARSVKGANIRDILNTVATKAPELIIKFGGHAMAAGLSIPGDKFDAFARAFDQAVIDSVDAECFSPQTLSDGELATDQLTFDTAQLLRGAGPWGQGFPEPEFDGVFELVDQRLVGEKHLKMTLRHPGADYMIDAIAFGVDVEQWPNERVESIRAAYRLDINEFRSKQSLQLIVSQLEPL